MADYHPLILRAVAGLEKNTGETRRALYERARKALVDQLRNVTPALSETDITRERLALEDAIRKVETEEVRRIRPEVPMSPAAAAARARDSIRAEQMQRAHAPETVAEEAPELAPESDAPVAGDADANPEAEPVAAEARAREGAQRSPGTAELRRSRLRQFIEVKAPNVRVPEHEPEPDQHAPHSDEPEAPVLRPSREPALAAPAVDLDEAAGRRSPQRKRAQDRRPPTPAELGGLLEPPTLEDETPYHDVPTPRVFETDIPDNLKSAATKARRAQEAPPPSLLRRFVRRVVRIAIACIVLAALAGTAYVLREPLGMMAKRVFTMVRSPSTQAPRDAGQQQQRSKIPDRIGGQSSDTNSGSAANQGTQNDGEATVAQRVVLYEEDPNDSAGKRYLGSVVWRAETVSPGPGQPPDRAVRADITIPERNMSIVWSLRRNTDKDLPASHTVSIMFTLPADFSHGGVAEIRGLLMKQSEQTRGVSLAGLSVKVTTGYFLVGLSSAPDDQQRNIQLLKERGWFDIAIVYNDGRRAILAVEKGTPGDRAFADAFAAWGQ